MRECLSLHSVTCGVSACHASYRNIRSVHHAAGMLWAGRAILTLLKSTGQMYCECLSIWVYVMCSQDWRCVSILENTAEVGGPFHHSMWEDMWDQPGIIKDAIGDHWGKMLPARSLCCHSLFHFPYSVCYITKCNPRLYQYPIYPLTLALLGFLNSGLCTF
jgi:hypothetical protein